MKPIDQWSENDLQALISSGAEESLELEYKRSAALGRDSKSRSEISKDVSAFANSNGGLLIYGVIEDGRVPKGLDQGVDPAVLSREWLEQVIGSTIQPRIQGIKIKEIALSNALSAFVVDIPKATTFAPHQAGDQKYYRRFNFESVPMHDYEVRDALRRATVPELDLRFQATSHHDMHGCQVAITIGNASTEPSLYNSVSLWFELEIAPQNLPDMVAEDVVLIQNDEPIPIRHFRRLMMPPNHMPIYREQRFLLARAPLLLSGLGRPGRMGYMLSCPGFSGNWSGTALLNKDQVSFEFNRIG